MANKTYISDIVAFDKGEVSPKITQDTPTSDVATANITIQSQAPFASATGTNRNSGNVIVNLLAAVTGGTPGYFQVSVAGTPQCTIGDPSGNAGWIWLGPQTPTTSNSNLYGDGAAFNINAVSSNLFLGTNNGSSVQINDQSGNAVMCIGSRFTGIETPTAHLSFSKTLTAPTINQNAQTTDTATNNLIITSQAPFASASTNKTPGNIIVTLPAAVAGGTQGYFQVSVNGAIQCSIGDYSGNAGWFWLGPQTPSSSNSNLYGDGADFYVNAVSGSIYLGTNNGQAVKINDQSGSAIVCIGSRFTGIETATAHLSFSKTLTSPVINQNAQTTDTATQVFEIQAQNAYTSASTNKTGGTLVLEGGAAQDTSAGAVINLTGGTTSTKGTVGIDASAIGGVTGVPWAWKQLAVTMTTTGTTTLTNVQYDHPGIIINTVTLGGAVVLEFPNAPGFWMVDISNITSISPTNTFSVKSGSTTAVVYNSDSLTIGQGDDFFLVWTQGSNTIKTFGGNTSPL